MATNETYTGLEIAIIGIGCRFPDADNWREYWNNLKNGHESVRFLTNEPLATGKPDNGSLIKALITLQGKELFDYSFFDYSPAEAAFINPLHRVFHQCVWEALEDAGYNPDHVKAPIGIYAGACDDTNWKVYTMLSNVAHQVDDFSLSVINNRDYLSTLLAYKLNLKGAAVNINTACSTSLVAVNMACKALLLGEARMTIAGGVSMSSRIREGYHYQEGMIYSEDGHCRAFDRDASGTVVGEGAGAVILKRLKDAQADGDHIYAIIKGSAINNDGNRKVGFTAPSVEGQVECIRRAQVMAKVDPATIGYVEAHGTGTRLGDPIEVTALNIAFNKKMGDHCALGSVKTNIGHLDSAAGVAGLIKAALALKFGQIPASLNFEAPNPEIDFAGGPFYVNAGLQKWEAQGDVLRRAAVSSFGIGGTNAHAILEEAPVPAFSDAGSKFKILTLSARTENGLTRYRQRFSDFLLAEPHVDGADLAFTMQTGRRHFTHRKAIVFSDIHELQELLKQPGTDISSSSKAPGVVVFMFPGQGAQYIHMGKELYESIPLFREWMDTGFDIIQQATGKDYRIILWPLEPQASELINETCYTQPLIFLLEYALSKYLMSLGVKPDYMIGHSLGEFVAACLSGVFSFEDAVKLVVKRGELMGTTGHGAMLGASLSREEAQQYLNAAISPAAFNAPGQTVFSGDGAAIAALETTLRSKGISSIRLRTSHAFHSHMQATVLPAFKQELEQVKMNKPGIPFIANTTGGFIRDEEATSVDYWANQLILPVLFADGIGQLLALEKDALFIEAGPGQALSGLVKTQYRNTRRMVHLMKTPGEAAGDSKILTQRLGQLWECGLNIDWIAFHSNEKRNKCALPTYPFEEIRFPAEVDTLGMLTGHLGMQPDIRKTSTSDWCYTVQWKQSMLPVSNTAVHATDMVLLLAGSDELSDLILQHFQQSDATCITVIQADQFIQKNNRLYEVNPGREEDFNELFERLSLKDVTAVQVVYMWNHILSDHTDQAVAGYSTLLNLVRGFASRITGIPLKLNVIAKGLFNISGYETVYPDKATLTGALRSIGEEFEDIACCAVDIAEASQDTVNSLLKELTERTEDKEVAIRGKKRYVKVFEQLQLKQDDSAGAFRENGTYLITGASGGMGQLLATFLSEKYRANLVLISRNVLPEAFLSGLKEKGVGVLSLQVDVSDLIPMQEGINEAIRQFGEIHGVLHTAGMADYGGVILRRKQADDEKVFTPKIAGTRVLEYIFRGRRPDFFINFSSIAASVGAFGEAAYVAANSWMDAFAESADRGYPFLSIEWTALRETGMAKNALAHLPAAERMQRLEGAITNDEFIEVLLKAINLKLPVVIISPRNFHQLLARRSKPKISVQEEMVIRPDLVTERPALGTPYAPPDSATEKKLETLLSTFTGIVSIGVNDNFLDLGIDSLKSMMLLKKLRTAFDIDFTLKQLFEQHTIRKLGALIDEINFIGTRSERTSKLTI